jgi:hypothetical protein
MSILGIVLALLGLLMSVAVGCLGRRVFERKRRTAADPYRNIPEIWGIHDPEMRKHVSRLTDTRHEDLTER